jgi:hypothetical protein
VRRRFVETTGFSNHRARLEREGELVDNDLAAMEQEILANPEAGDLVRGSGGLRKIRVGLRARGRGKSYGARVLYLDVPTRAVALLVAIFGKNEKSDLSPAELKQVAKQVKVLKEEP